VLADFEIRKAIEEDYLSIKPFAEDRLQPVSYDLTLSGEIRIPRDDVHTIDPGMKTEEDTGYYGMVPSWHTHTQQSQIPERGMRMEGSTFLLACTNEYVKLSSHMAARVEGKSSLGRLGLAVHITAGFIDPGFEGQITLEIANLAPWGIVLYPDMPIAQIVFEPVSAPERDYTKTGHYCGQRGPTESRYRLT